MGLVAPMNENVSGNFRRGFVLFLLPLTMTSKVFAGYLELERLFVRAELNLNPNSTCINNDIISSK